MTSWFEEAQKQCAQKWAREIREQLLNDFGEMQKSKEENTMKVSYKGVTGDLLKLERGNGLMKLDLTSTFCKPVPDGYSYNLEIWDNEKRCKVSFSGVSLKDVKFLGGEVTYG